MGSVIQGFDELRNSQGVLVAPLGFGFQADWETLERRVVSASQDEEFFWEDGIYDEVEIVCMGLDVGTDNQNLEMTLSTDGSTFHTGAGDYEAARHNVNDVPAQTAIDAGGTNVVINTLGTVADEIVSCVIRLLDVSNSILVKPFLIDQAGKSTSAVMTRSMIGGALTVNTDSLRGVNIGIASTNTFSGVIIIRGRRKTPISLISQDDWVVITDEETVAAAATHDFFWDDQVFDEIEITLTGILAVSDDDRNLEARLSSDGSTFHSGGSDYQVSFWNINSAGGGGPNAGESSTGAAEINLVASLGIGTDEFMDAVIHLTDVSGTLRKKKGKCTSNGRIADATVQSMRSTFMDFNTNDACQGIQLRGEGGGTIAFDRVRIRGRRKTPIGVLKQDWEVLQIWDHDVEGDTAEIEFTNLPVEEFEELEITATNVKTGTTPNFVLTQFSIDGGSTWEATAYDWVQLRQSSNAVNATEQATNDTDIKTSVAFGATTNALWHAILSFYAMTGLGHPFIEINGSVSTNDSADVRNFTGAGRWDGTGADGIVNGIRFDLDAGGNFTRGRMVLRGRRKAEV